jgi:hypothetical protein
MNREQLILSTKRYASLAAAKTCASLATVFTWLSNRCDDANTFFVSIEARNRG